MPNLCRWQKGEEKYPHPMFSYLPPTTIVIHSTNPSGSRSQGSHSYAVPGMRCTGQSKEDDVLTGEGKTHSTPFLVKSTLSAKVRGRVCCQPLFCSRLPMPSHHVKDKAVHLSKGLQSPTGVHLTFFSNFPSSSLSYWLPSVSRVLGSCLPLL